MKKQLRCLLAAGAALLTLGTATSCGNTKHKTYDNETEALIFAITDLDGVFNPFYYSTGNDGQIVGMTQISMFTTDKNAQIAYGKDEPVVVLDYEEVPDKATDTTTYTFVLKNPSYNVKYSNGSYITLKDVLFNLYEYLDPQYTGSSTMYSTDIIGLQEYRTQQATQAGQEAFEKKFILEADDRVNALVQVLEEIKKEHPNAYTEEQLKTYLQQKETEYKGNAGIKYSDKFVEDFEYVSKTFKEELLTDFNTNKDTYKETFSKTDEEIAEESAKYGSSYTLLCDIQTFFYAEGLITIDLDKDKTDPDRVKYAGYDLDSLNSYAKNNGNPMTQQQALDAAYEYHFPGTFSTIVNYWQTATTIREQFVAEAKEIYFNANTDRLYKDISGIKVITEDTKVNGKSYKYALYNSDGTKTQGSDDGYEMFSITINGVDPKAIWNFSFSVAPMYYYSNAEQIAKFNYGLSTTEDPAFGVEYGSNTFQTKVIKGDDKVGLPMGGGAYRAAYGPNSNKLSSETFFDSNVVYFERNDHFLMGKPKIKMIRYQITSTNQMLNTLELGQVHYCEPSAKPEVITKLNALSKEGFSYAKADTLGYGYIGINAKDVPSVYARRALMSVFNPQYTVDYYSGEAKVLRRPMSEVSWAYPKGAKAYYEYDSTGETAKELLRQAGYTQNSQGKMVDSSGKQFKLTFTIAGEDPDHPVASTFYKAEEILEAIGCDITVKPDIDALSKLNTGGLAVWAAAWSTTIDPDMYQTYHKDSTATSTLNWGYNVIKNDTAGRTYAYEQSIIAELSEKIEAARKTVVQSERKAIYAECLDLVMDLAVEFPTYQRKDLFAYNSNVIDASTMTPESEISPYNGPINQIWNLSLVTK